MQRTPVQPKETEYILFIFRRPEERSGVVYTVFNLQTTREFTNFRYGLNVDASYDPAKKEFTFIIGGIKAPASLLPGTGTAQGVHAHPALQSGDYVVTVKKERSEVNHFTLHAAKDTLAITRLNPKAKPFIDVMIGEPQIPEQR
jgi:hypothetical protein